MDPNLVILAGGISSRMKKSVGLEGKIDAKLLDDARRKSKSMIGVGVQGCPFMDHLLYNAREAGYKDVVIVVGENDFSIQEYYGRNSEQGKPFHGLSISYAIQRIPEGRTKPLGTADALLQALRVRVDWSGQKVTVCNSDNLYSVRALRLLLNTPHEGAMIDYDRRELRFDEERICQFAVVEKDAEGFLLNIIEKPSKQDILRAQDVTGRVGVSMNLFRVAYNLILPFLEEVPMHPFRLEKELPTAVVMMVKKYPKSMFTIPLAEHVPDLTSQNDIWEVQDFIRRTYSNLSWEGS